MGAIFVIFFIDEVKASDTPTSKTKLEPKTLVTNSGVIVENNNISHEKHDQKSPLGLENKSIKAITLRFFDPQLIKNSFAVIKKSREGNLQKILLFAIACQTMFFAVHGESGLYILFARTALRWTTEFGMFVMYMTAIGLLGE